jgi:predicted AlkP superfamily phosphohydrolase/phosphomutase
VRKLVVAACAVALASACVTSSSLPDKPRIVVLGIDGMDPELARGWMKEGRLPHLAALAARGGFHRLHTVPNPDCAAAWSSFAAGRSVATPVITHEPARLLFNVIPMAGEHWSASREGEAFWLTAGRAGVRTSVLAVPGMFPPEPIPNGELLAGFPLPDIRHTPGTYHFFATTVSDVDEGTTKSGGILRRLSFDRRVARDHVVGPAHPVSGEALAVPLAVTWNHEARSVNVELGPHAVHLREREWSRLLELDFAINPLTRVRGFTQLFLMTAGTEVKLYVSPINWHPGNPPAPISSPPAFARDLYDRLGLFRTLGWNAATGALNDEQLDEAAFLDDADRAFQDRAETILSRVDGGEWSLLVGVVDTPDRIQHMMWRLIDVGHPRYDPELARRFAASIEQSYQQADELLGEIVSRLPPETIVMVVSDHGFHTVRSSQKWSGDHTDADPEANAGLLVTNLRVTTTAPRLIDLAPTILKHFDVAAPNGIDGTLLFSRN